MKFASEKKVPVDTVNNVWEFLLFAEEFYTAWEKTLVFLTAHGCPAIGRDVWDLPLPGSQWGRQSFEQYHTGQF